MLLLLLNDAFNLRHAEGGPFSILPSKDFNEVNAEDVNVTFEDVRGVSINLLDGYFFMVFIF